jgi:hypothetical protein
LELRQLWATRPPNSSKGGLNGPPAPLNEQTVEEASRPPVC